MATKTVNQHYIPQLLLRGFAFDSGAKEDQVWVFRKGSDPFRTNPRNVGAERFFYADPDESSLEADLAHFETTIASLVCEIRQRRSLPRDSNPVLAELVGHLVARSKHTRMGFAEAGKTLARDAFSAALASERLRNRIRETIKREALGRGVELSEQELTRMYVSSKPEISKAIQGVGGLAGLIEAADIPGMAKKGQVGALEDWIGSKRGHSTSLTWKLLATQDYTLVLGDAGPIALALTKRAAVPGAMFSPRHHWVVLPLSDSLALVGGLGDFKPEMVNVDRLNTASAKLSSEFFVARANRAQERQLLGVVGKDSNTWQSLALKAVQKERERLLRAN